MFLLECLASVITCAFVWRGEKKKEFKKKKLFINTRGLPIVNRKLPGMCCFLYLVCLKKLTRPIKLILLLYKTRSFLKSLCPVVSYLPARPRRQVLHNESVVSPHWRAISAEATNTSTALITFSLRSTDPVNASTSESAFVPENTAGVSSRSPSTLGFCKYLSLLQR